MKNIIAITLLSFVLMLGSFTKSYAQDNNAASNVNFISKTKTYHAYFPIPHTDEVTRMARYLDKELQIHSYISAEYKSADLGHYVKYSITMEPLEKYKPYQDAVAEKVEELIDFYESGYEFQIPAITDYYVDGSWGKDITIEFFDGKIPAESRPKSHKPWVIRRLVFFNTRHVFVLEALGSMEYMYARATNSFFDAFQVFPTEFK